MATGVYSFGLIRRYPTDCEVDKIFVPSGRFSCIKGARYWNNSEIVFPVESPKSTNFLQYRTHFGWGFAHTGIILTCNNNNMRLAMRRITAAREPPGFSPSGDQHDSDYLVVLMYDSKLRQNQRTFIHKHRGNIIKLMVASFGIPEYHMDKVTSALEMLKVVHDKRKLRVQALEEKHSRGEIAQSSWLRHVLLKMKPDEFSKTGKYGRMIVDLGVCASLEAGLWADSMKNYIKDRAFHYRNGECYFCATPDPVKIMEYFNYLQNHPKKVVMVVFSDDAIISVMVSPGCYYLYNLDISSCDTSHTEALFTLLFDAFSCPNEIRDALHHQIMAPMIVSSYDYKENRNHTCTLLPKDYYLQSGITITTLINSFSQFLMLMSITDCLNECQSDVSNVIVSACEAVGYKITLERCDIFEDLQFLKMSPCMNSEGEYHALLNLGPIFRASGTCKGDIPQCNKGARSIYKDAVEFQSNLMSGLLSGFSHPVIDLLSPLGFLDGGLELAAKYVDALKMVKHNGVRRVRVDDALYRRYRLTPDEILELHTCIYESNFLTVSYSRAISKIMEKDYDLRAPVA